MSKPSRPESIRRRRRRSANIDPEKNINTKFNQEVVDDKMMDLKELLGSPDKPARSGRRGR